MEAFNMDNALFRTIGKLVDLIWVNILTLICALPIITAGASFTAMNAVLIKMAADDSYSITRDFFQSFRESFKQVTKVWGCILVILLICLYNFYLWQGGAMDNYGNLKIVSGVAIAAAVSFTLMVMNYMFFLFLRYENGIKQTVKNSVMLSFAFFPKSVGIVIIMFFPLALMLLSDYFFWLWFLYGFAYPGYFIAKVMLGIFHKTEQMKGNINNELE
ncbi:MAG: YesL family protein [Clostridiaceae bacterium]